MSTPEIWRKNGNGLNVDKIKMINFYILVGSVIHLLTV